MAPPPRGPPRGAPRGPPVRGPPGSPVRGPPGAPPPRGVPPRGAPRGYPQRGPPRGPPRGPRGAPGRGPPTRPASPPRTPSTPSLLLRMNKTPQELIVTVESALITSHERKPDPYVQLEMNGKREKTKSMKNTNAPVWMETFRFPLRGGANQLNVSLMDKDIDRDDVLARKSFSAAALPNGQSVQTIPLTGQSVVRHSPQRYTSPASYRLPPGVPATNFWMDPNPWDYYNGPAYPTNWDNEGVPGPYHGSMTGWERGPAGPSPPPMDYHYGDNRALSPYRQAASPQSFYTAIEDPTYEPRASRPDSAYYY